MIRPLAFSLAALLAAPAALAGPRLIVDADPGNVTVVIDHQPDVVIVERERVRRTRRVVRSRGYDVRPVYEREVIVVDDCPPRRRGFVPPGHRKHEWHHRHGGAGYYDGYDRYDGYNNYDRHVHNGHKHKYKRAKKHKRKKHKRKHRRSRDDTRWARW